MVTQGEYSDTLCRWYECRMLVTDCHQASHHMANVCDIEGLYKDVAWYGG